MIETAFLLSVAAAFAQNADTDKPGPWERMAVPPAREIAGLCFIDAHRGWVVSPQGAVSSTSDSGRTWRVSREADLDLDRRERYGFVRFENERRGWIAAWKPACMDEMLSIIASTEDGGVTWQREDEITDGRGSGMDRRFEAGNGREWTRSRRGVYVSVPDEPGVSRAVEFVPAFRDHPSLKNPDFLDVAFGSPNVGWLVGHDEAGGFALRTVDGGINWSRLAAAELEPTRPTSVCARGDEAVLACGARILKSRRDGEKWSVDWQGLDGEAVHSLWAVPSGALIALGKDGLMLRRAP